MSRKIVIEIPLKQFVVEALKKMEDDSSVLVIKEALHCVESPRFAELLESPNVIETQSSFIDFSNGCYILLLSLFSQGTYLDYLENKVFFPKLTESQIKKLQYLTIVTLANKMKIIPFNVLMKELNINNVKDLENLITEATDLNLISGELNQKDNCLKVNWTFNRAVGANDVEKAIETLQQFCENAVKMFFPQCKLVLLMLIKLNDHYQNLQNAVLLLRMSLLD